LGVVIVAGKMNGLPFRYYTIRACCFFLLLFFPGFFLSLSPKCSSLLYDFFASILLNYPFNSNRIEALLQALIGFGIRVATSMRKSSA